MTSKNTFVIDTSTIISSLLFPRSLPREAFDSAFALGRVLASTATIDELDAVLHRTKFDRYVSKEARLIFLAAYIRDVTLIDVTEAIHDCRDPKDNKFLEVAVSGNAICIVSSDSDLLDLHPYRDISIMTPHHFLASY